MFVQLVNFIDAIFLVIGAISTRTFSAAKTLVAISIIAIVNDYIV